MSLKYYFLKSLVSFLYFIQTVNLRKIIQLKIMFKNVGIKRNINKNLRILIHSFSQNIPLIKYSVYITIINSPKIIKEKLIIDKNLLNLNIKFIVK